MNPLIFNIQKFSTHDGDGLRTTIFFKGCPLSCRWCHNPEGQSYKKEIVFHRHKCTGCGACVKACPQGANRLLPGAPDSDSAQMAENAPDTGSKSEGRPADFVLHFDRSLCTACGLCADMCAFEARELAGKEYTVQQLVKEALKDRIFYEQSGGGVTLSGGEVMAQNMDFVEALCKALHREGVSVFIDTSGYAPYEHFARILPYVNTFLYDIKPIDPEAHLSYIGVDNALILENLEKLSRDGARIYIRIPVIPGACGDREGMEKILRFLLEKNIRAAKVFLLPYHDIGRGKFAALDRTYEEDGLSVPDKVEMEKLRDLFTPYFEHVSIGG